MGRRLRISALVALVFVVALIGLTTLALRWASDVPGVTFSGQPKPLGNDEADLVARLHEHVATIASHERNVPENPQHLEAAARYIERQLTALGYEVESQSYDANGHTVRNLAVRIGTDLPGKPAIVVGAHYDSFEGTPGANDNASGTAVLIELARRFRDLANEGRGRIRLAFFTNEEPPYFHTPLMGSFKYAKMLAERSEKVNAMYSLETLGYFSNRPRSQRYPFPLGFVYPSQGDFVAFVAMTPSRKLMQESIAKFRETAQVPSQGGAAPGFLPGIDWSDHWSFEQFNYPAIMITDTAYFRDPDYHKPTDTPEKLDYEKLGRVTIAVEAMIRKRFAAAIGASVPPQD